MPMKILNTKLLLAALIWMLIYALPAFAVEKTERGKEVSFTLDDRDRLIRIEAEVKAVQKQIEAEVKAVQKQIEAEVKAVQKQIDDVKTFMLWGFGILFGGMGVLIGFVLWDRRTALAPAINKTMELEKREELIEQVLREYAKTEPKLAEIMKSLKL